MQYYYDVKLHIDYSEAYTLQARWLLSPDEPPPVDQEITDA